MHIDHVKACLQISFSYMYQLCGHAGRENEGHSLLLYSGMVEHARNNSQNGSQSFTLTQLRDDEQQSFSICLSRLGAPTSLPSAYCKAKLISSSSFILSHQGQATGEGRTPYWESARYAAIVVHPLVVKYAYESRQVGTRNLIAHCIL